MTGARRKISSMIAVAAVAWGAALASGAPARAEGQDPCLSLVGATVPAAKIGLPTRGARVTSAAQVMPAQPLPGTYCRVTGVISPIDPKAPDIQFALALPKTWNGKAMMVGGGGLDGYVPDVSGPVLRQLLPIATPLMRGYAVFGGDGGHQQAANKDIDGSFMSNDEALANFGGAALKKTRDVAMALIERRYGRSPSRTYFTGASNGGHEAYLVAQRYPADFDGVIAAYPVWNFVPNSLQIGNTGRLIARPGAWMSQERRAAIEAATIKACDDLDGAHDGLISNYSACHVEPPPCGPNAAPADACVTPEQAAWLKAFGSRDALPYLHTTYPGFPVNQGVLLTTGEYGVQAPADEESLPMFAKFYSDVVRYGIARDPTFDWKSFDPTKPGPYAARIAAMSDLVDAKNPDLSAFERRGGKLLTWHGLADQVVSHEAYLAYHSAVVEKLGEARVRNFARFYLVPGLGHGVGHFMPVWDPLTVLERWVEGGVVPGQIIATDDSVEGHGRSRPLCEIGAWPAYSGGDINSASSFHCAAGGPR